MQLTVVLPMLDEAGVVTALLERVQASLALLEVPSEIVVVDDGSTDGTGALAVAAGARVVRNEQPTGQLNATLAGLSAAEGSWVAVLDGDGQDPPELLPELWAARIGHDAVYAIKRSRLEGLAFRAPRRVYGALLRRAGAQMPPSAGSYLLATRQVALEVVASGATEGNLAVLVALTSPRFTTVAYDKAARTEGRSRVGPVGLVREGVASLVLVWRARRLS